MYDVFQSKNLHKDFSVHPSAAHERPRAFVQTLTCTLVTMALS
jgi:hypothetical protein